MKPTMMSAIKTITREDSLCSGCDEARADRTTGADRKGCSGDAETERERGRGREREKSGGQARESGMSQARESRRREPTHRTVSQQELLSPRLRSGGQVGRHREVGKERRRLPVGLRLLGRRRRRVVRWGGVQL